MKKNFSEKLKAPLPALGAAAICCALVGVIYAVNGVWPFGSGNITYDDMAQGTLPIYYHIYDWLHGNKALFYDWYTGLGVNVVSAGTVTPLDLLLCLFKRENLLYALSILIPVKFAAAAASAQYCMGKMFPGTSRAWSVLFAVLYAMSTYSLRYYTNSFWLDFVIIFPFVVYGARLLFDDGKPALYTAALCVTLLLSIYQGFMVIFAIFFVGGLYLLLMVKKEDRAQRACLFGLATVAGGLLSCWHALPMALQTLSSKRLETSFDDAKADNPLLEILNVSPTQYQSTKLTLLIGLQIAAVLVIALLIRLLKQRRYKQFGFFLAGIVVLFAPITFENVNLLWHAGSYVQFPMRFFFICIFLILCFSLYSIQRYGEVFFKKPKKAVEIPAIAVCYVFTMAFLAALYSFVYKPAMDAEAFSGMSEAILRILAVFFSGVLLFSALQFCGKFFVRSMSFCLCLIQIVAVGVVYMPDSEERKTEEFFYNNEAFIEYCNEVSAMDTECGALGRVKNSDTSLNTNYPFVLAATALSNWTHTIPKYMQDAASALGYSTQYTRITDSGGTALTDGILGVKKLIKRSEHPVPDQYSLIEQTESFSLYRNEYAVEFGLTADERLLNDITTTDPDNRFELQNKLWQIFSGSDDEIFDFCTRQKNGEKTVLSYSDDGMLTFTYTAAEHELLYINTGKYEKQSYKIHVNGQRISAPYNKQTSYGYYPSASVNGFLCLGSFNAGETAEIVVECINGEAFGDKAVQVGSLCVDRLKELNGSKNTVTDEIQGKTSLSFNFSTEESRYLFIPVTYDSGWSCKINGERAEVYKALGAYIAVKLPAGSGSVEMKWQPSGMKAGIALTLAGVLAAIAIVMIKKRNFKFPKPLATAVLAIFAAVLIAAIAAVYLFPMGYQIIASLKK